MPSITDEIMQMAEEYALLRESNIRGRTRQKHRERLKSRLSALEQELEGYRKQQMAQVSVGRLQARAEQARANLHETIRRGNGVIARSDQPVTLEDLGFHRTIPTTSSGLPCPSEYLSAQTGFTGEEGG